MDPKAVNIVIGGEAGQGLATAGELLARILVRSGYSIVVTQSYESRIRGGHNTFSVRVAPAPIEAPQESIDILVALNEETIEMHRGGLAPGGVVLADEEFACTREGCLGIPFGEFPGEPYRNTAAVGVISAVVGLDGERAADTVAEAFGKKKEGVGELNREAFLAGFHWGERELSARRGDGPRRSGARAGVATKRLPPALTAGAARKGRTTREPPPAGSDRGRLMLNGNQAIALGAVSAGARFCSFYPMTPSTSVPLTLIGLADAMGLVVEQAEDEIAAINMAIGASFAGAPSIVATSGGGFALMVEGVSLAAMTETPLVVVVAQRPAPATGLPTRTEQADLEFVAFAGHGEFPRAIYAPGSVEECFHLTRRAFALAERCQGPVFVLTDQYLADSFRAVEPFEVGGLDFIRPGADPLTVAEPYRRHAVTEGGVSPRLLPGGSRHLVVTDSDEHTEDGHLTEDLTVRARQVEKRLAKAAVIAADVLAPAVDGDEGPELLLVSWGSTGGAVREAASVMRERGASVGTLHFSQVWPLVPGQFAERLGRAGRVVCIEGNATGQLAGLIRRASGFEITERIGRYDGLPITPEYVLRALETQA